MATELRPYRDDGEEVYGPRQLRLNSATNARKSFSRIIRMYNSGELDERRMKAFAYAFTTLQSLYKIEKDMEIEERLKRVEQAIERQGKG